MQSSRSAKSIAMRCLAIAWSLSVTGCMSGPGDPTHVMLMARDNGATYMGAVDVHMQGRGVITTHIDRRIYGGRYEPTAGNTTFGFIHQYGRALVPGEALADSDTTFARAILSSTDNRVLRCDIIGNSQRYHSGICEESGGRVYDIMLSAYPEER